MNQIGQLAAYALWVGSSFAFIALVPTQDAPSFLSIYATGSLIAALFSIPIYTSWRSRTFDLIFVGACVLAIAATFAGFVFPAYWMAAVALNIVDFSVAQTGKPKTMMLSRILISLCALLLMVDFALALYLRLALCAVIIGWSTVIKEYEGHKFVKLCAGKVVLTALTCTLHYIPLIIIPHVAGQYAKFIYLAYAIAGSVVLKMQDFIIKNKVSKFEMADTNIRNLYYGICGIASISFFVAAIIVNPFISVFVLPIIALIVTIRIVDDVSWT